MAESLTLIIPRIEGFINTSRPLNPSDNGTKYLTIPVIIATVEE
jgi:hypothetical protein